MQMHSLEPGGARLRRRVARGLALGAIIAAIGFEPFDAKANGDSTALGISVETILDAAHRMSPTLRAAALDTAAAAARAERADALDDPMLSAQTMQVPGHRAPMDQTTILLEQEFPLWGKLDLRKSRADAMLDAARGEERGAAVELDEKIKIAFARYYAASQACAVNADVIRIAGAMDRAARARYAQALGGQADALLAQAETTKAKIETLRLEGRLRAAAADLNALLARAPNAPLAEPLALRALPNPVPNIDALAERVRSANPVLFAQAAEVRGAQSAQELAQKAWYPDVTLGAGPQTNEGSWGYAAMVGLKIPLQWGAKESAEREADANLGAAEQRLAASTAEIDGELGQAVASLSTAEEADDMRRTRLIPQLTAAYKSALAAYASGHGDFAPVLEAVHRLHDTQLELLETDVEAQTALAMIERLIGSDL